MSKSEFFYIRAYHFRASVSRTEIKQLNFHYDLRVLYVFPDRVNYLTVAPSYLHIYMPWWNYLITNRRKSTANEYPFIYSFFMFFSISYIPKNSKITTFITSSATHIIYIKCYSPGHISNVPFRKKRIIRWSHFQPNTFI